MARPFAASASVQYDSAAMASYMDGVQVKIAEAYKPPRKIALPAAYNNKFPDVSKYSYNFNLEKSVLEKMREWKEARRLCNETRRIRLEKKEKRKKVEETSTISRPSSTDSVKNLPIKSAPAPEAMILTPQPLSPPPTASQDRVKTNGLDYADFDNDTSSPFDNMELKTINDMEELAQVLQPNAKWVHPSNLEDSIAEITIHDDEEDDNKADDENKNEIPEVNQDKDDEEEIFENLKDDTEDSEKLVNSNQHRSVSVIVEELRQELTKPYPHMQNWKPWPDLSPEHVQEVMPKEKRPSDPLLNLSEEDQQLAKHLSDMGFPISRAARAIRELGGEDNKRIVEYLLAVQSLGESGISEDDAEKALAITEYDVEKAKRYHENLCTLRDLGFPEDQASMALLKCDIDRDKALDFLIA